MTTEEKFTALSALCDTCLRMRAPGDWYVCAIGRQCLEGAMLCSHYGNGKSPEAAIEDDWKQISVHPCIVLAAMSPKERKHVRWNGYMWQDITPANFNG